MIKPKTLRVAALQTGLYPADEARAIREGVSLAKSAAKKFSPRLICFPEHWLVDKVLRSDDDDLYHTFKDLAKQLDSYINLGGIYEGQAGNRLKTYFISPTISPKGKIISKQKKVHLFRRENKLAVGGDAFEPFLIDDIRVGVMVCHDVVFPESARILVLKGSELLLNPSLIPASGIKPWKIYVMARALENRVPIVAPNPYLSARKIPGRSTIIGLRYEKEQGIMQVEEVSKGMRGRRAVTAELHFEKEGVDLRKERLSERKPQAYVE
jgi:predicted amidohydrolase